MIALGLSSNCPKKKDNIIPNSKKNNPKNILIDFKLIRI
jgi:hypothetical protein